MRSKVGILLRGRSRILGTVRYHRDLRTARLRYARDVVVWLPPTYQRTATRRYPVLYIHDGQNLFDPGTAFAGQDWGLDQSLTRLLAAKRIEELIVVGISNSRDRLAEYSPSRQGLYFAEFVVYELKPFIDRVYRTKPGRETTAVMGSSMGGLISFCFAWWFPEIFYQAGCISPSFLWNDYQIVKEVASYSGPKKTARFYIDVGSEEVALRVGYEQMIQLLKARGYRRGADLQYHLVKGAGHNERDWGKRVWRPITFMFGIQPQRPER